MYLIENGIKKINIVCKKFLKSKIFFLLEILIIFLNGILNKIVGISIMIERMDILIVDLLVL